MIQIPRFPEIFPQQFGAGGKAVAAPSPLLTDLISYWKMDEVTGNRLDSVGSRTLIPQGTVGYDVGILGNCVTFPGGATDHLLGNADATLTAIDWSLGFSVAGWFYIPTAFVARSCVLTKQVNGNNDWSMNIYAANACRFTVNDSVSGSTFGADTTAYTTDAWHCLIGRYSSASKKAELRLDGNAWQVALNALPNVPKNSYNQLAVCRSGSAYGISRIDSVALWTRYITDAEADLFYNAGVGKEYPF